MISTIFVFAKDVSCRISLPQNQPIMSNTPPVLVVCSHNQFMTQNIVITPGHPIPVEILSQGNKQVHQPFPNVTIALSNGTAFV
jgi:hypothetical protein